MPIDPDTLAAAIRLRPRAVAAVLNDQAPFVYRLAYALAGRWDIGRGIARFVLARSIRVMPKWHPEDEPSNWFGRFTIMTSRRSIAAERIEPDKDVLITQALAPDGPYLAFVAALRHLDAQPREAFLLNHCEHLNARYAALAMDCSTQAAETHLRVADQAQRLAGGAQFDALLRKLADAYKHLTPEPSDLLPTVNRIILRRVGLRRWLKRVIALIILILLAALAYAGWKMY